MKTTERRPGTLSATEAVRLLARTVRLSRQLAAQCGELIDRLPGGELDRLGRVDMGSMLRDLQALEYQCETIGNVIDGEVRPY